MHAAWVLVLADMQSRTRRIKHCDIRQAELCSLVLIRRSDTRQSELGRLTAAHQMGVVAEHFWCTGSTQTTVDSRTTCQDAGRDEFSPGRGDLRSVGMVLGLKRIREGLGFSNTLDLEISDDEPANHNHERQWPTSGLSGWYLGSSDCFSTGLISCPSVLD